MSKELVNVDDNLWKIVLIKTIEDREPVYYRLANLSTYEVLDIPAYRILDEVINKKKNIINLKCSNNAVLIINEDGYEGTDECIIVDEFDKEISNLYEWAISGNELGTNVISTFDTSKNSMSPSNFKISSDNKIAWTCKKGHTIYCDFPTYFGNKCKCPICQAQENGKELSLNCWAQLTRNIGLLEEYKNAEGNDVDSHKISYKSKKKVYWRRGDEEVLESVFNVTVKGIEPPFKVNANATRVNLTR